MCIRDSSYAAPLFNYKASGSEPTDPVTGSLVISDFFACNEIADGILSDHPERTRALLIESANPVHSLAESEKFRKALQSADFSPINMCRFFGIGHEPIGKELKYNFKATLLFYGVYSPLPELKHIQMTI